MLPWLALVGVQSSPFCSILRTSDYVLYSLPVKIHIMINMGVYCIKKLLAGEDGFSQTAGSPANACQTKMKWSDNSAITPAFQTNEQQTGKMFNFRIAAGNDTSATQPSTP